MKYIDTRLISPLHPPRQKKLLAELVASMRSTGWQGRPLLVIERADDYQAWTGSHRLAAARKAKLETVPCHVVDEADIKAVGGDAVFGHVDDADRLKVMRQVGDDDAVALMWQEGQID